jgi:hydrogenase maturation protease
MAPRWTVLVCGDRSRGDDGAALDAAAALPIELGPGVEVRAVGQLDAGDLTTALTAGRCLVLDAVRGARPGEVVNMPLARVGELTGPIPASSHAMPLATIVAIAEALGADVDRGTFVGIGGTSFELGRPLSRAVRRGLPDYVDAIVSIVGSGQPEEVAPCA